MPQCPGSYAPAETQRDQIVLVRTGGRYATGTCPVCECRVGVMRPTRQATGTRRGAENPNRLNFGTHNISAKRLEANLATNSAPAAADVEHATYERVAAECQLPMLPGTSVQGGLF